MWLFFCGFGYYILIGDCMTFDREEREEAFRKELKELLEKHRVEFYACSLHEVEFWSDSIEDKEGNVISEQFNFIVKRERDL